MSLRKLQSEFVHKVAILILFAEERGYELTFGDAYRDPRVFGKIGEKVGYGRSESNHKIRLAIDLNLFLNGEWLTKTEDFQILGEFWESIGGTWGGRFNDGNHFSMEYKGHK